MNTTLLKRLNIFLYSIAVLLLSFIFLPLDEWFYTQNLHFKLAFFAIPFLGLATLPTAIYTKNVRQILFSIMLIVCYFLILALITTLTGLFGVYHFPIF